MHLLIFVAIIRRSRGALRTELIASLSKLGRYASFLDAWEDSTLMSFTAAHEQPPVEAREPGGEGGSMKALDATIAKWKEQKLSSYSDELYMVAAMRAEIEALREKVLKQDLVISFLTGECAACRL
jgi:hypothetical protein